MTPDFPKRVYTFEEVEKARKLVESGYKHRLTIKGRPGFKKRVKEALQHVKTAGYYIFLRSYIKRIVEIEGFSQLREADIAIWANMQLLENPIEAAGFFVQKAFQMKQFLEGKSYYGGAAEARSIERRIQFLKALKERSADSSVEKACEALLKRWAESTFVF